MTRVSLSRRQSIVVGAEILLVILFACQKREQKNAKQAGPMPDNAWRMASSAGLGSDQPYCPHNWEKIPAPQHEAYDTAAPASNPWPDTGYTVGSHGLSVPALQTNIPEFNDCQRLILPATAAAQRPYGPLVALFASQHLSSFPLRRDNGVLAAAEVLDYSVGFAYGQLGIQPAFNCLYVYGDLAHLKAKMVPVGIEEQNCGNAKDTASIAGVQLAVLRRAMGQFPNAADYPAVARWDWDEQHHVQYIGIACGAAWCEIGPGAPSDPSRAVFTPAPGVATTGSTPADRVVSIPGYQDHQKLQSCGGVPASGASGVDAWVTADPNLPNVRKDPSLKWQLTAHVAIQSTGLPEDAKVVKCYKDKFNWDEIPQSANLTSQNTYALCWGTRAQCGVPDDGKSCKWAPATTWWASITSAVKPNKPTRTIYKCVHFTPGAGMPNTVDFHFLDNDETVWQYCTEGCCEVASDGIA